MLSKIEFLVIVFVLKNWLFCFDKFVENNKN